MAINGEKLTSSLNFALFAILEYQHLRPRKNYINNAFMFRLFNIRDKIYILYKNRQ